MNDPKIVKANVRYSNPVIPADYLWHFGFHPNDSGIWNVKRLVDNELTKDGIIKKPRKQEELRDSYALHRGFEITPPIRHAEYAATIAMMAPGVALQLGWPHHVRRLVARFLDYDPAMQDIIRDTYLQGFAVQLERMPGPQRDELISRLEVAMNESGLLGRVKAVPASIDGSVVAFASPKLVEMLEMTADMDWRVRHDLLREYGLRDNKIKVLSQPSHVSY